MNNISVFCRSFVTSFVGGEVMNSVGWIQEASWFPGSFSNQNNYIFIISGRVLGVSWKGAAGSGRTRTLSCDASTCSQTWSCSGLKNLQRSPHLPAERRARRTERTPPVHLRTKHREKVKSSWRRRCSAEGRRFRRTNKYRTVPRFQSETF